MASGLPLIAGIAFANYYLAQLYGLPRYLSLIFIPYLLHRSSCVEARPGTVQTGLDEESSF